MTLRRSALAALAAAGLLLAAPQAGATTVQPILLDLNAAGRAMNGVITVQNTGSTALPVEIRVERLKFGPKGAEVDKPSEDLVVFPLQTVIAPNGSQVFRVQWVGDAQLKESRSYYVTVAQTPVALPKGQSAVQVVYNFQTLVNVRPVSGAPKLAIVSAAVGRDAEGKPAPVATVGNDSPVHGYFSRGRVRVVQRDDAGKVLLDKSLSSTELEQGIGFGLVGPGQQRTIVLPVRLPAGQGHVDVSYTAGR